jgi:hypothetical protein
MPTEPKKKSHQAGILRESQSKADVGLAPSALAQVGEQRSTEVAFAERRDGRRQLARIFRPARDLDRRPQGRASGNSHQKAFFARGGARGGEGVVVLDGDDFVVNCPACAS